KKEMEFKREDGNELKEILKRVGTNAYIDNLTVQIYDESPFVEEAVEITKSIEGKNIEFGVPNIGSKLVTDDLFLIISNHFEKINLGMYSKVLTPECLRDVYKGLRDRSIKVNRVEFPLKKELRVAFLSKIGVGEWKKERFSKNHDIEWYISNMIVSTFNYLFDSRRLVQVFFSRVSDCPSMEDSIILERYESEPEMRAAIDKIKLDHAHLPFATVTRVPVKMM
ncbi:hypothetical protein PFISCL1PPCAC_19346, partial [Pristionchus fissidentatus]